jgi:hypothetical protein
MGGWSGASHRARDCRVFLELKRRALPRASLRFEVSHTAAWLLPDHRPRAASPKRVTIIRIRTTRRHH